MSWTASIGTRSTRRRAASAPGCTASRGAAASTSGAGPGFEVGGQTLPLDTANPYFGYTLSFPNLAPLTNSLGILDAQGTATALFSLPPGVDPSLTGLTLHHACAVFGPGVMHLASNATPTDLVP